MSSSWRICGSNKVRIINDIVLNVQSKKNTTIKLSEMYVWDDSASLGGI